MAYRLMRLITTVGDDSNLQQKAFDRDATMWQTLDNEVAPATVQIAPGASEATIALGTIAQAYSIAIYADYPVLVRLNGPSATQFQLTSNNVPARNVGAPLPASCFFACTALISSLRLAPIAGAAQTANVWLVASGDPTSAYI